MICGCPFKKPRRSILRFPYRPHGRLARALFWQQLLDTGRVANVAELAAAEHIDRVRIQKTLKLARLAPELIEDIARGEAPVGLSLEFFIRRELPDDWDAQRAVIAALSGCGSETGDNRANRRGLHLNLCATGK